MTTLLFSYGTLQDEHVQMSTFGRLLAGHTDHLPGFERSLVPIEDPQRVAQLGKTHHDNVTFTGATGSGVEGMAFEVTDGELALADSYEQLAAYARVAVTLASGRNAWVYMDVRSIRNTSE